MINKYIYASSSRYDLIYDEFEDLRKTPQSIVFVPSSKVEYPFRLQQEQEILQRLNLTLASSFSLTDEVEDWSSIIKSSTILYLHGGNPLVFLDYLKEKGVFDLIKNYKGTIIGLSAGAMLMSENIVLTPSNEEYNQFITKPAFGFSHLNIFPHLNYQTILPSQSSTGDGIMKTEDLIQLSYQAPIDLLADDHFIVVENNKIKYLGDYFYRIDKGQVQLMIDNVWHDINYHPINLDNSILTTSFDQVYNSMNEAMNEGYYHHLFSLNSFSFFSLDEPMIIHQQCNHPSLKTWILNHPEFVYGCLSLIQIDERTIERFTFRTRYLKVFEELKIWEKLLTF